MADSDSDLGAFMAGFLLGGMIGAGVALLLAPQSGEETREMLRERSIELKGRAEQAATDFRSKAETTFHEGRERIDEAVETARKRVSRRKPGAAEGGAPS
ncbi:MAG: YtxH domain-containing protein [Anaerolineales bacterium]|jgi:gas vesicle protein